jgi:hypothetical protein
MLLVLSAPLSCASTTQSTRPALAQAPKTSSPSDDEREFAIERAQLLAAAAEERRRDAWSWAQALPNRRLVIFYGNPQSPSLGPLGAYPDDVLVARLRQQAQVYQDLDPTHPVVPAFDFVTPIAQPSPMADGSYVSRTPDELIEHYAELASREHILFFLDLQIGRSDVGGEVDRLWKWIERPGVNVALDPEFAMGSGEVPGVEFGHMSAASINAISERLASTPTARWLPKILLIHQFIDSMLPDRGLLRLMPGVDLVICSDGVGGPESKIEGYQHYGAKSPQYGGIKLFYSLDKPVLSEKQVLQLAPAPLVVMYQ